MLDLIPTFPESCEVSLELAPTVAPFLRALRPTLSEFTFTNLFLFRRAHGYRVSRLGGLLLVEGHGYDGRPYAFPPLGSGDVEEGARRLCERLVSRGGEPILFPVSAEMIEAHFRGGAWSAEADRDQADYVYLREELATLPGSKFHKRRNRLQKFLREQAEGYSFEPLGPEHEDACAELADQWCGVRCSLERPSTYLETSAAKEAVRLRGPLGLRGGVILLGRQVRAWCLGEELNPETFVVHFEKAEAGREGLAQLINRDFCARELARYTYVDREQDLGDPGLRQAKEAYQPVWLTEKYRLRPA